MLALLVFRFRVAPCDDPFTASLSEVLLLLLSELERRVLLGVVEYAEEPLLLVLVDAEAPDLDGAAAGAPFSLLEVGRLAACNCVCVCVCVEARVSVGLGRELDTP